jgi:hypothetical protein
MAFSVWCLARTIPETDSWGPLVVSLQIHIKSRTRSTGYQKPYPRISRTEPEPNPGMRPAAEPRKTAKTEFLGFLSARDFSGGDRFSAGMGVGMPRPQLAQRRQISRRRAACRAGVVRAARKSGVPRGGGNPRKRTLRFSGQGSLNDP